MRGWLVLIGICLTAVCAPIGAPQPISLSPSPPVTARDTAAPSAGANTFTMPTDRDMITFAADRGALIAFSSKDAPPPYESKIQRADPGTGAWRTIYTSDAMFLRGRVAAGRVAIVEYRQSAAPSVGAYSQEFTVVNLGTGAATTIDHFAMSSASFRGGGGGPRRPVGSIALGPDRAAWTRLVEGPGGSVTGELRVALVTDPARATPIASSSEWIAPLAVDAHRLLYVIGGKTEDQLHTRDLDTGADKVVLTGAVGDTQREGGIPGFDAAVLAGDWAVWLDTPGSRPGTFRAVNVISGVERSFEAGGSSCNVLTAGTRYLAWYCAANTAGVLDARTLEPARDIPAIGATPEASDDGLIWITVIPNGRTVTLFRPRT